MILEGGGDELSPWIRAESSDFASFSFCVCAPAFSAFCSMLSAQLVMASLNFSQMVTPLSKLGKGATFFGQVLPIIRSQRQLGYLFGSIPSPPQMIEEVSTGKEGTTTKTLVQNPAYEDWICTASTPPFLQKFWRRWSIFPPPLRLYYRIWTTLHNNLAQESQARELQLSLPTLCARSTKEKGFFHYWVGSLAVERVEALIFLYRRHINVDWSNSKK